MKIVDSWWLKLRTSGVIHQITCCLFALFVSIKYPQAMVTIWVSMLWTITTVLYDIYMEIKTIRYLLSDMNFSYKINNESRMKDKE